MNYFDEVVNMTSIKLGESICEKYYDIYTFARVYLSDDISIWIDDDTYEIRICDKYVFHMYLDQVYECRHKSHCLEIYYISNVSELKYRPDTLHKNRDKFLVLSRCNITKLGLRKDYVEKYIYPNYIFDSIKTLCVDYNRIQLRVLLSTFPNLDVVEVCSIYERTLYFIDFNLTIKYQGGNDFIVIHKNRCYKSDICSIVVVCDIPKSLIIIYSDHYIEDILAIRSIEKCELLHHPTCILYKSRQ
jgi:hypothetical protein